MEINHMSDDYETTRGFTGSIFMYADLPTRSFTANDEGRKETITRRKAKAAAIRDRISMAAAERKIRDQIEWESGK